MLNTKMKFMYVSMSKYLSAAKAALDMQMSVSLKITLIFLSDLLVYFIIANRTEIKLKQSLKDI